MFLVNNLNAQVSLSGGNLGYTSFMDGFGFPGFVSDQYFYYNHSGHFTDHNGHHEDGKMHNLLLLTSWKWCFENPKILGGWPGIDIELPIMFDLKVHRDPVDESEHTVGGLFVGLFLQYPKMMLFNKMPIWQRLELLVKFPTGHYDNDNYVNADNNAYVINPYYAFTVFLTKKIEFSARIFYKWTSKNDDPPKIPSLDWDPKSGTPPKFADSIQEGQAVWANFASSYGITDNIRLGVNGYYLIQVSDHKIDGHSIPHSREKVLAIGPGLMYITDKKKDLFWLNVYDEVMTRNRPDGTAVNLRWLHVF
jgi:anthranilate 1,2-dioxygenase (deaminating, decarboxylating) large subunit